MPNSISLKEVIDRTKNIAEECEHTVRNMDKALRNIQYLALALSFQAEDKDIDSAEVDKLLDDARYASNLRNDDLHNLNDKILEFFVDFLDYIHNNKDIHNLFEEPHLENETVHDE